jgi:O-antigen biosynthesis protein
MKGPAKRLTVLKRYRANLAPLRFGAGIKGKIADSWIFGTPCCTTEIGAEGMALQVQQDASGRCRYDNWGGLVGTTVDELVDNAVKLYTDVQCWESCRVRC